MAGRSKYTEDDRARCFVVLTANQGNIKRTARDTGFPENTVRRWARLWDDGVDTPDATKVAVLAEDALSNIERVRDLALVEIEKMLRAGNNKLGELNAVFGTLTDKANAIQGIANSRVEHVHSLPSADEMRALLQGAVQGAIEAAASRQDEIVDAEVVEVSDVAELSA